MGLTVYNVISSYSPLSPKRKFILSSTYFISKPPGGTGNWWGGGGTGRARTGGVVMGPLAQP